MSSRHAVLGLALLLLLAAPARGGAQALRVTGAWRDSASALIREVAAGNRYLVLDRDTVLPADFRRDGDLVVAGATVRLEGWVTGRVVVLGGELFVRPGARIDGAVAVAGGEVYPSRLATTGPVLAVDPGVTVRVTRPGGAVELELSPPLQPPRLALTGAWGVGVPTYDRVDGLTLAAGARLRLGRDPEGAALGATGLLHTARGAAGGVVRLEAPVRGGVWGVVEGGRRTLSNERWIRGDLANSLAALLARSDLRDYHSSTYLAVRLERRLREPLLDGEGFVGPWLELRLSEDRSLAARDVWSVVSRTEPWRANPPISEGRIASARGGAELRWQGPTSRADGTLSLEWAPEGVGDFSFLQAVVDARLEATTPRGHQLALRAHGIGTASPAGAPAQRWSFVGGPGTLPTEDDARFRGDQLVWLHAAYAVPLAAVVLPVVGSPSLTLQQATGTAWVGEQQRPDFAQSLGAGVQFRLLHAELWIDPARGLRDPVLTVGAALPF